MADIRLLLVAFVAAGILGAAYGDSDSRQLLSGRDERQLAGTKTSVTPKKTVTPVNCAGSWSAWGACVAKEMKSTYSISKAASNGGTVCPEADGGTKTKVCETTTPVKCAGAWGAWGACTNSKEARTYKVSTAAANGGAACPKADGATESQACDPNMKKSVNWKYVVPKEKWGKTEAAGSLVEIPIVVCPKGGSVVFTWTEDHDVWSLPSEAAYVNCAFKDAKSKQLAKSTVKQYTFSCTDPGTHFFACSMNDACQNARQRIRVHVADPAAVVSLKAKVDTVTGEKVPTMANIMENDIADVDYNGFSNDARAAKIVVRLQSAMRYSPDSCSDWLPAHANNKKTCDAALASDLGFVMRARPTPNVTASREYYALSLKNDPKHCGTLSYLTELEVKENRKDEAMTAATNACAACGASIDVLLFAQSFKGKGWTLPEGVRGRSCTGLVPKATAAATTADTAASGAEMQAAVSALMASLVALSVFGSQ